MPNQPLTPGNLLTTLGAWLNAPNSHACMFTDIRSPNTSDVYVLMQDDAPGSFWVGSVFRHLPNRWSAVLANDVLARWDQATQVLLIP